VSQIIKDTPRSAEIVIYLELSPLNYLSWSLSNQRLSSFMHILRKYTTNMYNCVKLSVHMF